jgi:hypothetical protein
MRPPHRETKKRYTHVPRLGGWVGAAILVALCVGCSAGEPTADLPGATSDPTATVATHSRVSLPWAVMARPSRREVDVAVAAGGCDRFTHLDATRTPTTVVLMAVGWRTEGQPCAEAGDGSRAEIILQRDPGHRRLVHAPVASDLNLPYERREARGWATLFLNDPGAT